MKRIFYWTFILSATLSAWGPAGCPEVLGANEKTVFFVGPGGSDDVKACHHSFYAGRMECRKATKKEAEVLVMKALEIMGAKTVRGAK